MYNGYRKESSLKLLYQMIKKQLKMPKKIKYKLSEYRLNDIRRNMYDLERAKLAPLIALNQKTVKSINLQLDELRKQENQLVKYRLKA